MIEPVVCPPNRCLQANFQDVIDGLRRELVAANSRICYLESRETLLKKWQEKYDALVAEHERVTARAKDAAKAGGEKG